MKGVRLNFEFLSGFSWKERRFLYKEIGGIESGKVDINSAEPVKDIDKLKESIRGFDGLFSGGLDSFNAKNENLDSGKVVDEAKKGSEKQMFIDGKSFLEYVSGKGKFDIGDFDEKNAQDLEIWREKFDELMAAATEASVINSETVKFLIQDYLRQDFDKVDFGAGDTAIGTVFEKAANRIRVIREFDDCLRVQKEFGVLGSLNMEEYGRAVIEKGVQDFSVLTNFVANLHQGFDVEDNLFKEWVKSGGPKFEESFSVLMNEFINGGKLEGKSLEEAYDEYRELVELRDMVSKGMAIDVKDKIFSVAELRNFRDFVLAPEGAGLKSISELENDFSHIPNDFEPEGAFEGLVPTAKKEYLQIYLYLKARAKAKEEVVEDPDVWKRANANLLIEYSAEMLKAEAQMAAKLKDLKAAENEVAEMEQDLATLQDYYKLRGLYRGMTEEEVLAKPGLSVADFKRWQGLSVDIEQDIKKKYGKLAAQGGIFMFELQKELVRGKITTKERALDYLNVQNAGSFVEAKRAVVGDAFVQLQADGVFGKQQDGYVDYIHEVMSLEDPAQLIDFLRDKGLAPSTELVDLYNRGMKKVETSLEIDHQMRIGQGVDAYERNPFNEFLETGVVAEEDKAFCRQNFERELNVMSSSANQQLAMLNMNSDYVASFYVDGKPDLAKFHEAGFDVQLQRRMLTMRDHAQGYASLMQKYSSALQLAEGTFGESSMAKASKAEMALRHEKERAVAAWQGEKALAEVKLRHEEELAKAEKGYENELAAAAGRFKRAEETVVMIDKYLNAVSGKKELQKDSEQPMGAKLTKYDLLLFRGENVERHQDVEAALADFGTRGEQLATDMGNFQDIMGSSGIGKQKLFEINYGKTDGESVSVNMYDRVSTDLYALAMSGMDVRTELTRSKEQFELQLKELDPADPLYEKRQIYYKDAIKEIDKVLNDPQSPFSGRAITEYLNTSEKLVKERNTQATWDKLSVVLNGLTIVTAVFGGILAATFLRGLAGLGRMALAVRGVQVSAGVARAGGVAMGGLGIAASSYGGMKGNYYGMKLSNYLSESLGYEDVYTQHIENFDEYANFKNSAMMSGAAMLAGGAMGRVALMWGLSNNRALQQISVSALSNSAGVAAVQKMGMLATTGNAISSFTREVMQEMSEGNAGNSARELLSFLGFSGEIAEAGAMIMETVVAGKNSIGNVAVAPVPSALIKAGINLNGGVLSYSGDVSNVEAAVKKFFDASGQTTSSGRKLPDGFTLAEDFNVDAAGVLSFRVADVGGGERVVRIYPGLGKTIEGVSGMKKTEAGEFLIDDQETAAAFLKRTDLLLRYDSEKRVFVATRGADKIVVRLENLTGVVEEVGGKPTLKVYPALTTTIEKIGGVKKAENGQFLIDDATGINAIFNQSDFLLRYDGQNRQLIATRGGDVVAIELGAWADIQVADAMRIKDELLAGAQKLAEEDKIVENSAPQTAPQETLAADLPPAFGGVVGPESLVGDDWLKTLKANGVPNPDRGGFAQASLRQLGDLLNQVESEGEKKKALNVPTARPKVDVGSMGATFQRVADAKDNLDEFDDDLAIDMTIDDDSITANTANGFRGDMVESRAQVPVSNQVYNQGTAKFDRVPTIDTAKVNGWAPVDLNLDEDGEPTKAARRPLSAEPEAVEANAIKPAEVPRTDWLNNLPKDFDAAKKQELAQSIAAIENIVNDLKAGFDGDFYSNLRKLDSDFRKINTVIKAFGVEQELAPFKDYVNENMNAALTGELARMENLANIIINNATSFDRIAASEFESAYFKMNDLIVALNMKKDLQPNLLNFRARIANNIDQVTAGFYRSVSGKLVSPEWQNQLTNGLRARFKLNQKVSPAEVEIEVQKAKDSILKQAEEIVRLVSGLDSSNPVKLYADINKLVEAYENLMDLQVEFGISGPVNKKFNDVFEGFYTDLELYLRIAGESVRPLRLEVLSKIDDKAWENDPDGFNKRQEADKKLLDDFLGVSMEFSIKVLRPHMPNLQNVILQAYGRVQDVNDLAADLVAKTPEAIFVLNHMPEEVRMAIIEDSISEQAIQSANDVEDAAGATTSWADFKKQTQQNAEEMQAEKSRVKTQGAPKPDIKIGNLADRNVQPRPALADGQFADMNMAAKRNSVPADGINLQDMSEFTTNDELGLKSYDESQMDTEKSPSLQKIQAMARVMAIFDNEVKGENFGNMSNEQVVQYLIDRAAEGGFKLSENQINLITKKIAEYRQTFATAERVSVYNDAELKGFAELAIGKHLGLKLSAGEKMMKLDGEVRLIDKSLEVPGGHITLILTDTDFIRAIAGEKRPWSELTVAEQNRLEVLYSSANALNLNVIGASVSIIRASVVNKASQAELKETVEHEAAHGDRKILGSGLSESYKAPKEAMLNSENLADRVNYFDVNQRNFLKDELLNAVKENENPRDALKTLYNNYMQPYETMVAHFTTQLADGAITQEQFDQLNVMAKQKLADYMDFAREATVTAYKMMRLPGVDGLQILVASKIENWKMFYDEIGGRKSGSSFNQPISQELVNKIWSRIQKNSRDSMKVGTYKLANEEGKQVANPLGIADDLEFDAAFGAVFDEVDSQDTMAADLNANWDNAQSSSEAVEGVKPAIENDQDFEKAFEQTKNTNDLLALGVGNILAKIESGEMIADDRVKNFLIEEVDYLNVDEFLSSAKLNLNESQQIRFVDRLISDASFFFDKRPLENGQKVTATVNEKRAYIDFFLRQAIEAGRLDISNAKTLGALLNYDICKQVAADLLASGRLKNYSESTLAVVKLYLFSDEDLANLEKLLQRDNVFTDGDKQKVEKMYVDAKKRLENADKISNGLNDKISGGDFKKQIEEALSLPIEWQDKGNEVVQMLNDLKAQDPRGYELLATNIATLDTTYITAIFYGSKTEFTDRSGKKVLAYFGDPIASGKVGEVFHTAYVVGDSVELQYAVIKKPYDLNKGLFRKESEGAKMVSDWGNPNINKMLYGDENYAIFDTGKDAKTFDKELVTGTPRESLVLFQGIMNGVQGYRDKGYFHGDLKPANVVVVGESARQPLLIDNSPIDPGSDDYLNMQWGYSPNFFPFKIIMKDSVAGKEKYDYDEIAKAQEFVQGDPLNYRAFDCYALGAMLDDVIKTHGEALGEVNVAKLRLIEANLKNAEFAKGENAVKDSMAEIGKIVDSMPK